MNHGRLSTWSFCSRENGSFPGDQLEVVDLENIYTDQVTFVLGYITVRARV